MAAIKDSVALNCCDANVPQAQWANSQLSLVAIDTDDELTLPLGFEMVGLLAAPVGTHRLKVYHTKTGDAYQLGYVFPNTIQPDWVGLAQARREEVLAERPAERREREAVQVYRSVAWLEPSLRRLMWKRITSEIPLVDPQIANPETRDPLRGCGGFFSGLFNPCILLSAYQRTGVRLDRKSYDATSFPNSSGHGSCCRGFGGVGFAAVQRGH
jgi:hypothetical protein